MSLESLRQAAADVKCYYCGHVSGQIIAPKGGPLRISNFVPRPGYTGPPVRPGIRLRCERCQGPVFLEDTTLIAPVETKLQARPAPAKRAKAA